MFSFFRSTAKVETFRTVPFEIWVKTVERGTFVTVEKAVLVDVVDAENQQHADHLARAYGGYATVQLGR